MRTSNQKNEKIIKTCIYTAIIIFVFIFVIKTSNLKESKDLIIDSKSIISMIENNKTEIIYDYIKNRDKVYVLYAENYDDKKYIKTHFPSVKFIGRFKLIFYTLFFKDNIMFYASDDKLIDKLRFFKIHYSHVVLDINNINSDEYLTLKDSYNIKLFLSFTNKDFYNIDSNHNKELSKYLAVLDKDSIRVVDGDTIKYKDNYYRFIGLDAPELKQNYGTNVKAYVENKIKNASNVSMLVGSYDTFGRILCHLFIDDIPLAYPMMKDKQAKETIMKYGDNGFVTIASNIVYLSKFQGRRPFTDPAKFRSENR
ncbi:thermonuclease family protein [Brachyspira hyodysenteriae]|uniref:thermonuclease family protein n=1 Tax=Brachyspira hyodysenteriae TaxID=159 RepID=UPI00063DCE49|nr:thermonuclease [Brachyspira hyodysenteriae]KLI47869.1 thermonuclease [Brachyspira hyodysenteriae]KLI53590.1 thermonuclease [Brachyspira hyodysenteriae]MCZ9938944.1 thermonuclease family protein [Brachyspira hyodysenteriae]MDA0054576.1 thermonuclease family protein [Brachyspira hyodysenteriae]TVL66033.1 thermonuclease [Brachyspira hyodysenteriae]